MGRRNGRSGPGAGLVGVVEREPHHCRRDPLTEPVELPHLYLGSQFGVLDGHPATLTWLGGVAGHRVVALGVDRFGQSGDIPDLYREYGLDSKSIVAAVARVCLDRLGSGNGGATHEVKLQPS